MIDIANNLAGTVMGIINALGNTMGFVAPMIVGYIINNNNDLQHWQVRRRSVTTVLELFVFQQVFWIAFEAYTFGSVIFLLLGSSEEQDWNRSQM